MENSETTADAARENTGGSLRQVSIDRLFALVNIPYSPVVHLFYTARLMDGQFGIGMKNLSGKSALMRPTFPGIKWLFRSVSLRPGSSA